MATICENKINQSFTDIRMGFYQSPTQDRMTLELCVAWQIKQLDNKVVDLVPPAPPSPQTYLGTLLQHFFFKSKESFLNRRMVEREWQEVCERLLFPKTFHQDFNSCDRRWDCRLAGSRDNCQQKKMVRQIRWVYIFTFPQAKGEAAFPHRSVLPLLVSGCWWMSLCQTQDACVSPPFFQLCI